MGLMIYSDISNSESGGAEWLGSILVVIACGLYATANIATEFIVKNHENGRVEYLCQMGLWGTLWSSVQLAIVERDEVKNLFNSDEISLKAFGWFACFWVCLFMIYSLMPVAFEKTSAVFVNLGEWISKAPNCFRNFEIIC